MCVKKANMESKKQTCSGGIGLRLVLEIFGDMEELNGQSLSSLSLAVPALGLV